VLRVCGASGERNAVSARRCWCGGLFCGRGGYKRSKDFRRTFRKHTPALTRGQFDDLVGQASLLDGDAARELWIARVDGTVQRQQLRVVK
jgi:hypothetical protein